MKSKAATDSTKIYRVLDANFNRAKEALRVCEDVSRFLWDEGSLTASFKNIRHRLSDIIKTVDLAKLIKSRNIASDVGKKTTRSESRREKPDDILFANLQRLKESLRVLEEFSKLISPSAAIRFKKLRYDSYALEKKIVEAL